MLANNKRHGQAETVLTVLQEMARRGIATKRDYAHLTWNQDRVAEVLQPFKKIASAVIGNQRVAYTEAGGLKIGRSRNDPEWMWIDTCCGIKTPSMNAVFGCYLRRPGDEPEFQLRIKDMSQRSFNADGLEDALQAWKDVAAQAAS